MGPEFIAIWIAWLLAGGSPGPATMGIAGTAMASGRRSGLAFALGILAGSASWGIAAALGLSAIMLTHVWMFEIIRYAGAAYLAWLALKALKSAWAGGNAAAGTPFKGSAHAVPERGGNPHYESQGDPQLGFDLCDCTSSRCRTFDGVPVLWAALCGVDPDLHRIRLPVFQCTDRCRLCFHAPLV